jgi:hypothetical protein
MWISSSATAYDGDGGRRVTHSWTVRRCLPNWREPNRGCCRVNFPHDYARGVREASGLRWNDRCDTGANARAALPCLGSFWRGLLQQDRRTATINAAPRAFPWPTSQVTDEANRIRRRADNGDEVRRPAASRRFARRLAAALHVHGGYRCGVPDAGALHSTENVEVPGAERLPTRSEGYRSWPSRTYNPKVAGSNPAPATMNDEGLADARAANPFRLPRLHPGIGLRLRRERGMSYSPHVVRLVAPACQ